MRKILRIGGFSTILLGLAVFADALLAEPRKFTLRRSRLALLPEGAPDITVLHLSDLHMTGNQHHKAAWIKSLRNLNPDVIVNTGDNLGGSDGIEPLLDALKEFSASNISALSLPTSDLSTLQDSKLHAGIYVWGSNDFFGPRPKNPLTYLWRPSRPPKQHKNVDVLDTDRLQTAFQANQWFNANNRHGVITVKGVRIALSGTNDPHLGYDRYSGFPPDSDSSYDIRWGITHAPYQRIINQMTADGAALIFAGHTHGGQVCLPTGRALTTNCDLPTQYAKGVLPWHHGKKQSFLSISAGLGTSRYAPFRLFCRPEATLVTLTAKNS